MGGFFFDFEAIRTWSRRWRLHETWCHTQVIECLKFGTTGQAPPGSASGKAFVHDPKVTGVSEVKAQLKLRFKNYGGQRMVVVRSMQLTQKKTTATFKQLDGVIRATKPDGSKTSYTHKCGELDKTVPIMIGVSRAVLESVIFCHQEDSSWPLQEGAVLKKRFDDIFDSARYTKALDVLNKQKKGLASKAKDISGDLKGLHADKVAAQDHHKRKASAEKAIESADAAIKASDDKQAALRDEKSRISDKMRKLQAQEQGLQECRAEVDGLERSLKYLEERLADSALMDEDDDVLAATASSCVENYSRLAISAQRPWFRPKLGHGVPLIHSTERSEQHLTPTARDHELKGA